MNKIDSILVTVRVTPALKEYIKSINDNSDIIFPTKNSLLWGIIKMHLKLVPDNYIPTPRAGVDDSIRIALPNSRRTKVYSLDQGRTMEINTLFRNYLDEEGQRVVALHLTKVFKQSFRSYMTGALSNNSELGIKDAVNEFCSDHNIEMDHITYDMLRKDWYRYKLRFNNKAVIPLNNQIF